MTISTLIPDIYEQVQKKDGWFNAELSGTLSTEISKRLSVHFNKADWPSLRLSQMGPRCPRALWYSIHRPELAEALQPWAEVKYSFGHVLEALAIALAKAAGHTVTGEQDEISVDGIIGHRDCVIDGCVVDVKSASSRSFTKFKNGTLAMDDSFGYLEQLDGYVVGSLLDPSVTMKDKGYILAIDKQLGHMCLYEHRIRETHIRDRIRDYKRIIELSSPPNCECGTQSEGKSGNIRLDVRASYSAFKWECFPKLRCFLYANGPVFLSEVVRKPEVMEINRDGKAVYRLT